MNKITKAIIPVAGYGTRRLPITKAVEKAMLPVGNRPIVDYTVEDCVRAGIRDIYFVINDDSKQIETYFGRNLRFEKYLKNHQKSDKLKLIEPPKEVKFHYIRQNPDGRYGTAMPVELALKEIGVKEPVVVLMGDDFIYNHGGVSNVAQMVANFGGENVVMLGALVNKNEVEKYGVIRVDERNNFVEIVEKPTPQDAPSNMINVSKYILPPRLLESFGQYLKQNNQNGEYYLTDVINGFVAEGNTMKVVPAIGQYLDSGTLDGWLRANEIVGQDLLKS
jgi:UTP--glucose-1-phosphate uridylyltransferase